MAAARVHFAKTGSEARTALSEYAAAQEAMGFATPQVAQMKQISRPDSNVTDDMLLEVCQTFRREYEHQFGSVPKAVRNAYESRDH